MNELLSGMMRAEQQDQVASRLAAAFDALVPAALLTTPAVEVPRVFDHSAYERM